MMRTEIKNKEKAEAQLVFAKLYMSLPLKQRFQVLTKLKNYTTTILPIIRRTNKSRQSPQPPLKTNKIMQEQFQSSLCATKQTLCEEKRHQLLQFYLSNAKL